MSSEMNIIKRLQSKTPKFFKIILRISLVIGFVSGGVVTANQSGLYFPERVVEMAKQILWIATTVSIMSKLPIEEKDKQDD